MKNRYFADFDIKSIDINTKKQLILKRLFQFFQETAGQQLNKNKLSVDYLAAENCSWVISRFAIQIEKIPVWRDKIRVVTWVSSFDGQTAIREYQVIDKKTRKIIINATARWVIIDKTTRKRTNNPLQTNRMPVLHKKAIENSLEKLDRPVGFNCERNFTVRYSEIDFNLHVNNTRYPMWMLDTLGMDYLNMHMISYIEINYISELRYGDEITVRTFREKTDGEIHTLAHEIVNTETDKLSSIARTIWKSDKDRHISEDQLPHVIDPKIGHECPKR
ncbi:MAG: hypothetical protein JXR63_11630 [Spirochaetales bacterium]|nr:hypothetical protein [Spirochaetales bacterium]